MVDEEPDDVVTLIRDGSPGDCRKRDSTQLAISWSVTIVKKETLWHYHHLPTNTLLQRKGETEGNRN